MVDDVVVGLRSGMMSGILLGNEGGLGVFGGGGDGEVEG